MIAFYLVYRFVPNAVVASQDAWPGAITAGVLFVIAQNTFVYFTTTFTSFPLVYGSIAAVIVLLLWAWISSLILLFGAEISAECAALRRCR
jgi:membrane protein